LVLLRLVGQSVFVLQHAQLEADTVLATPATASWPNTASLVDLPQALLDRQMLHLPPSHAFHYPGQHKHPALSLILSSRRSRNPLFPAVGAV